MLSIPIMSTILWIIWVKYDPLRFSFVHVSDIWYADEMLLPIKGNKVQILDAKKHDTTVRLNDNWSNVAL